MQRLQAGGRPELQGEEMGKASLQPPFQKYFLSIYYSSLRVGSWGPIKKQRGVISAIKEMRTEKGVTYLVWRFKEGVLEEVASQKGSKG